MPRFVCIECFDFVEQCGHTDRENMYPAEPVKKEKIETAQKPLKSKIYIAGDLHEEVGIEAALGILTEDFIDDGNICDQTVIDLVAALKELLES
jgi:hypothetical protein